MEENQNKNEKHFSEAGRKNSSGFLRSENEKFLSLSEMAKHSLFSKSYLAAAIREGKLRARKIGNVWHTNQAWFDEFEKEMGDRKKEYRSALSKKMGSAAPEKDESEKAKRETEPTKIQPPEFSWRENISWEREKINREEIIERRGERKNFARNFLPFLFRSGFVFAVVVLALVVFKYVDQNYFGSSPMRSLSVKGGAVLGEETPAFDKETFSSEHFRLAQVTFGGDVAVSPEEMDALEVNDIKSELVTSKSKKEVQLLISWKTNKSAVGGVEYGKSGGALEKIKKEDRYSYAHSVMLPSLDPATAYSFVVSSRDKWDNEKKSEKFAFYTGAPDVSLIDLLTGAARETFGWAIGNEF